MFILLKNCSLYLGLILLTFHLSCTSYMEIYNEKVRDLLAVSSTPSKAPHNLKIREHPKEGPYVERKPINGDLLLLLLFGGEDSV